MPGGSLRLDDDPFASFLDHDPFEAALKSTDRDYHWVIESPRSRRAEAKYADDDQDDVVPLFTHARIAAEKSRTRSVAIGTDPPKEVPKEEFERLEEKLEELKKEAAEDLADDGSVDSELEERIKELQETLVDVVPVEKGPPTGLRLLRAAARAVRIFVAAPRVAVRRKRQATRDRDRSDHLSAILDAFQASHEWLGSVTHAYTSDLQKATDLSPNDTSKPHKQRKRALELASRADNLVEEVCENIEDIPPELIKLTGLWAVDRFYAPAWYLWRCERKVLQFDELGATRQTLWELEDDETAALAAKSARARLNVAAPTVNDYRYVGDNFTENTPACVDAGVVDDVDGFPCCPQPWPRILGRCFERRPDDPPPPIDPVVLRALLLNFVVGRVLIPWVVLRPFLVSDPPSVKSERERAARNSRAVASLLWRALLKVGGPHADLAVNSRPSRGVEASEANSAEIAWQYMQPRSIANRMMCRPRVPYARSRLVLCGNHAIEQRLLRGQHRVDGVGRPIFDFHTGPAAPRPPPERAQDGAPPWTVEAPCDADVHAWIVSSFRRMPKREAFLQDQDLVRVLYPEDAWGAGAAEVLEQAANDIAADLATLGDRVVCAVLEARGVR